MTRSIESEPAMSANQKPLPLYQPRHRKNCPVCGEVSYSAAGIHPQCAVSQADPNRGLTKPREPKEEKPSKTIDLQRWQKACPKCHVANHVRKKTCVCGHEFVSLKS